MSSLTRLLNRHVFYSSVKLSSSNYRCYSQSVENPDLETEEEFRVLNLRQSRFQIQQRKKFKKSDPMPPRTQKMAIDQDWGAVWPGPRTFHPASVPLPLRQGFTEKGAAPPSKYGNAELMKIPNFLHLTPPVIKRQCEALKKFCTPWPKELTTDEKCKKHFPIDVITSDYCHALPTIRNPLSRIVTIKVQLSNFQFDKHAKDKFLRLVADRYDPETDILTITTDRCPLRKQNYDYAMYLLTACYHESFITEPWETTKTEADMETYYFNRNRSKISAEAILNWGKTDETKISPSQEFANSVENLINDGENEYNLQKYKNETLKLLSLTK